MIAGIFLNRLTQGMRLDADVSLCYGIAIPYDQCRSQIATHLDDVSNPYNTRQNAGLPPTPISSPTLETVSALINYQKSDYLFYLHDDQGGIHYGRTIEEHNANKANYL